MAKSANGAGSIRRRTDGRWEGRYTSPKDGKQKSIYGATQKEVRQKLTAAIASIDAGVYSMSSNLTIDQWVNRWLSDCTPNLRGTTRNHYEYMAKHYIIPELGRIKLSKLTKANVQVFYNRLLNQGYKDSTVGTVRTVLSSALSSAVSLDMIPSNPCRGAKLKMQFHEKMHIIDRDKMSAFCTEAAKTGHEDILVFSLLTGMRIGELRGLRWADINFDQGTICIARQMTYIRSEYAFGVPKGGKSRIIHPPKAAFNLLRRHRINQQAQRMRKGIDWIDDELSRDLVFRTPDGRHYCTGATRNVIKKIGENIGIPGMTQHDLRHSFAVAALRSGMDIKTLQNALGHADPSITLKFYSHYTDDMGKAASQKMDLYLDDLFV